MKTNKMKTNYYPEKTNTENTILTQKSERLIKRFKIINDLRLFFANNGFLEVETPLRIKAPAPELNIDTEQSGDHFLIASPELQMKRLLAAGYNKIFQICHCFRAGEYGDNHLPEFTMIEWYRTNAGIDDLMLDCENMISQVALNQSVFPEVCFKNNTINLNTPWPQIDVNEAFKKYAGWTPGANPDPDRFNIDLAEKVEPSLPLNTPVFLTKYPASMASLAKIDPLNKDKALRFELYAGGLELANGFAELTDANEQKARFEQEEKARRKAGKPPYPSDELFLKDLENLDPCAGIALGIDRLVMLLTNAKNIDDVVAFTPMIPSMLF